MLVIPLNIDFIGVTEAIPIGPLQRVRQSRGLLLENIPSRLRPDVLMIPVSYRVGLLG